MYMYFILNIEEKLFERKFMYMYMLYVVMFVIGNN